MLRRLLLILLLFTSSMATATVEEGAITVIASIKPVAMLVSAIAHKHVVIDALLSGAASPHHYALKPSDIKRLNEADLIVWVGPKLETFLLKPLLTESMAQKILQLDDKEAHAQADTDAHYWLDPLVAVKYARLIAAKLTSIDPGHANNYAVNADKLITQLEQFDKETQKKLQPVRDRGFVVVHDAYHHFISRYQLNQIASITDSADHRAGLKTATGIRTQIQEGNLECMIMESLAQRNMVASLTAGSQIQTAIIDPLAASSNTASSAYLDYLRSVVNLFYRCLSEGNN